MVGLPVAEGGWSIRHADAVLDGICGVGLSDAQQADAKHHYFTVQRLDNNALHWTTPLGRSYDRTPRPLLRGW